jgi:hypothetical protein
MRIDNLILIPNTPQKWLMGRKTGGGMNETGSAGTINNNSRASNQQSEARD